MDCSTSGFPVHHQLPELAQTHVHWVSDAIQPSHPLLFPHPPAFSLSQNQGLFQGVSSLHQVVKVLEYSFSINPPNEYSGLISFRMDWLDLLAVQGTLKSLLQHHSSKASILQCSAFFMVQLSHPYTTTGKAITLTGRTFVGNVMFLLFNMQSSLVIAFLPRSKRLLISWLIIRSLQLHAVHSKTYHCQLAALMVTVSGLWASVMAGAHISANMHLCSSKGSPASVFMYILRKEGKKKKIQKRKGHGDDKMSSEEFGGKAIMSADGEPCKLGTEQARHTVSLELSTVSKSSWCTCRCLIHMCDSEVAACVTCLSMPLKSRNREEMQSVNARNRWKTASIAVGVWPAMTTCLARSPRLLLSFKRPCNFCSPGNHERPWLVTWHGSHTSGTFRRDSLNLLYMQ